MNVIKHNNKGKLTLTRHNIRIDVTDEFSLILAQKMIELAENQFERYNLGRK